MDSELQQAEYTDAKIKEGIKELEGSEPGTLAMLPPVTETEEESQQFGTQISTFLAELPEYLGSFFNEYKLPVISFALLVVTVTLLRIMLAVLDAVNDIPLLSPLLELTGIGYTIWFTSRYLLKGSTRQELGEQLNSIKKEIIG
ncbi:hypothetical protein SD80_013020 [Scytonema tolypothrichoides VB-61278]|nr:hypothetical protein SD80_013020 [Scytonema tolypothrichoides VB-61278]